MEDRPSFACGCGTEVSGLDRDQMFEVVKRHICCATEESPAPWYNWIFSVWGWAIVATIGFVVLMSLNPQLWDK